MGKGLAAGRSLSAGGGAACQLQAQQPAAQCSMQSPQRHAAKPPLREKGLGKPTCPVGGGFPSSWAPIWNVNELI